MMYTKARRERATKTGVVVVWPQEGELSHLSIDTKPEYMLYGSFSPLGVKDNVLRLASML